MNLARYWHFTYIVQMTTALGMFFALPFYWHEEHGTGLQLMDKALTTTIRFGIDPFHPGELPVSQWWIVWIIPFMGLVIGLRAYVGLMFKSLTEQHLIIRLIGVLLFLSSGWYIANFYRDLRIGFWLEIICVGVQLSALAVEIVLPAPYISESRFVAPLMNPQVEAASTPHKQFSPICPECGTMNDLEARQCRVCKADLYRY